MNSRLIRWRGNAERCEARVVISGDFCPREENCADVAARAGEITAKVKPFFDAAEFRIVQWECAVTKQDTPIDKSGPNHRCYPECAGFAEALDTDAVLLANNHIGDYGDPGVKDSLDTFRASGIRTAGAGMTPEEAAKPLYFKAGNIEIALLNACECEFGTAWNGSPGSNAMDPFVLAAQIKAEKAAGKRVIVALHGGHEHFPFPSPRMRSLCRFLADSGADAVYNCHTHCILGCEVRNGVPIVYSPGNFYFPNRPTSIPTWYLGYVPKFYFDAEGACALELLPYFNLKQEIRPLEGELFDAFFKYFDELSAPIADDALLGKIFDGWCALNGVSMLNGLFNHPKPASLTDREEVKKNLGLRNLYTCQAHNDLIRNTLFLMERYALKEAEAEIPRIRAARDPEWLKGTAVEEAVKAAAAQ